MLPKQVDDLVQLFVVAVAVHKDFKLRVASFGFPGFYVQKVNVVFLEDTSGNISRSRLYTYTSTAGKKVLDTFIDGS